MLSEGNDTLIERIQECLNPRLLTVAVDEMVVPAEAGCADTLFEVSYYNRAILLDLGDKHIKDFALYFLAEKTGFRSMCDKMLIVENEQKKELFFFPIEQKSTRQSGSTGQLESGIAYAKFICISLERVMGSKIEHRLFAIPILLFDASSEGKGETRKAKTKYEKPKIEIARTPVKHIDVKIETQGRPIRLKLYCNRVYNLAYLATRAEGEFPHEFNL